MSHPPKTAPVQFPEKTPCLAIDKYRAYRGIICGLILFISTSALPQTTAVQNPFQLNLEAPMEICRQVSGNNLTETKVASDNETVLYIPTIEGKLNAVDILSGEKNWETDLGGEIISTPLVHASDVYVVSGSLPTGNNGNDSFDSRAEKNEENRSANATLRRLNKITGITIWKRDFAGSPNVYLFSYADSIIAINNDGCAYEFNKTDGKVGSNVKVGWEQKFGSELTAIPYFTGSHLLLGSRDRLNAWSLENNQVINVQSGVNAPTALAQSLDRQSLLWGDEKGFVHSFDIRLKQIVWRFRSGAQITFLKSTAYGLLIVSKDNFIYLLTEKTGKLVWKKRLAGRIASESVVNGNYAVFTPIAESNAVVVELPTGRSINNVASRDGAFFTGATERVGNFLLFQTSRGFQAFSNPAICRQNQPAK